MKNIFKKALLIAFVLLLLTISAVFFTGCTKWKL